MLLFFDIKKLGKNYKPENLSNFLITWINHSTLLVLCRGHKHKFNGFTNLIK